MGFLLFLLLIILVVYWLSHKSTNAPAVSDSTDDQLVQRNRDWAEFIAGYYTKVKSRAEKALIERMMADIAAKGLPTPILPGQTPSQAEQPTPTEADVAERAQIAQATATAVAEPHHATQIDNITLLLYFGAFLFVTSVGLFIAFGGASGVVRTAAVALVLLVMYGSGISLFRNKPKLKPAGLAFAGIGIAIAPLVGLAAYNYAFHNSAATIWFLTSVLCFGLYSHALVTLRKPLINYIFIFTFLSLFESGVSVIHAPIYYFGWAMVIAGMLVRFIGRWKGFWPELQESAHVSAHLFLPLALLVSLVVIPTQGIGQLGISLLLAAVFYGLEAASSTANEREINAAVAQVAALSGASCVVYAINHSWQDTAVALLVLNLAQALGLWLVSPTANTSLNYASILMIAGATDVLLSVQKPTLVLLTVAALVVIGMCAWWRQKQAAGYGLAALAWTALPLIYGIAVAKPPLGSTTLAGLVFAGLVIQLATFAYYRSKNTAEIWLETARGTFLVAIITVMIIALLGGAGLALGVSLATVLTILVLAELDKQSEWPLVAGLVVAAPMLNSWGHPGLFLAGVLLALLVNIGLTLRYRQEAHRWISTALWIVVPLALGNRVFGAPWGPTAYAWAYLAVTIGLVLSRAIARGVVFVSSKVPLASFARSASLSYVVGYTGAAALALIISLGSDASQLHTSLIAGSLAVIAYVLATTVEKRADIMVFIPLLSQFMLWSAVRPTVGAASLTAFLLGSSALAVGGYFIAVLLTPVGVKPSPAVTYFKQASLITTFIAPASFIFIGQTIWPMPIGLALAGALLFDYVAHTTQENREMAGGVLVAAVLWLLWLAGIRETQAYTHVIALTFGGYAYWRYVRRENKQSDDYLKVMLATATVPLALQALGGQAGGLYGWWLLLEQIFFMLLGITIQKRFVIFWGLYVAIAAVLYQLRHLGWAALTVLAIFIIGVAVYRLQKYNQHG